MNPLEHGAQIQNVVENAKVSALPIPHIAVFIYGKHVAQTHGTSIRSTRRYYNGGNGMWRWSSKNNGEIAASTASADSQ